jgi:N-acetylmuramoyl-L-alanine amidase
MKKIISILLAVLTICAFSATALADGEEEEITYTEEDLAIVARVIFAESRSESWEGKVAVGEVVFNRFESGAYGDTLTRVTRKSQFSKASVRTVNKKRNADLYNECFAAALYASTERSLPSNTYYFQRRNRAHWYRRPSIIRYTTIGRHTFYTLGDAILPE